MMRSSVRKRKEKKEGSKSYFRSRRKLNKSEPRRSTESVLLLRKKRKFKGRGRQSSTEKTKKRQSSRD